MDSRSFAPQTISDSQQHTEATSGQGIAAKRSIVVLVVLMTAVNGVPALA
jgi:hypothetical protein